MSEIDEWFARGMPESAEKMVVLLKDVQPDSAQKDLGEKDKV